MAASETYLVPVDFSKTLEIALDYAIRLARALNAKLQLLHAVPPPTLPIGDEKAEFLRQYYDSSENDAIKRLTNLVGRKKLGSGKQLIIVRTGDPARVIADQAQKSRASMIIMGSHGRTGLERLMLGSVAERTIRYAKCPVPIVKT